MAIKIPSAIEVTAAQPVDTRLVLTKAEMVNVIDAKMPDVYLCVCKDDKQLYIYNKNTPPTTTTGKFTKYETGGGGGGTGDKNFKYEQSTASTEWVIEHNLNKFPSVTTVHDYSGTEYIGDVIYNSENKLTIRFNTAVSGYAFLN